MAVSFVSWLLILRKIGQLSFINNFQPKVVTAIDEADLARRMERAEMENAEVSGDEDESDNEEGMKFDGDGENSGKDSNQSGEDEE
jgi:translation initiation factor 2 subunit 1